MTMFTVAPTTHDLVIKGGRVFDPGQGLDAVMDISVRNGRITAVEPDIDTGSAGRVVEADGRLVTPGLIDLHTHVAGGIGRLTPEPSFIRADIVGVHAGVTTVVDAGSSGAYNVAGMTDYVVPQAKTRVLVFINAGIVGQFQQPEIRVREQIDVETSVESILRRPDVIRGVKVRMVGPAMAEMGIEVPRLAKQIAVGGGVPMMVHIGDIVTLSDAARGLIGGLLTDVLTAGDIVTHTLSHQPGALLDKDRRLVPQAMEARERGVYFDTGFGRSNFTFSSARAVMDQGLIPDTISSDITTGGRMKPIHSLTECMNKLIGLGMSVEDVVLRATANPAKVLGMQDEIGALKPGHVADISILEVTRGDWTYRDNFGEVLQVRDREALAPVVTVRNGEVAPVDFGPHPWGWLPERLS